MNKTLIMLSGIPGAGKSTWVKQNIPSEGEWVIASTDDYITREAKKIGSTYNAEFTNMIDAATTNLKSTIADAIKNGKCVVYDQTNLTVKVRRSKMMQFKNAGYDVVCVYFINSRERAEQVNIERGFKVPPQRLIEMFDVVEPPTMDEGFDVLMYMEVQGNICAMQKLEHKQNEKKLLTS